MQVKVKNMLSNNARKVPNQFIIETEDGEYFQSYDSVIAYKPTPKYRGHGVIRYEAYNPVQLDKYYWDYSTTTGKYRNQFLGETIKETRAKIKSGEYILVDLNLADAPLDTRDCRPNVHEVMRELRLQDD